MNSPTGRIFRKGWKKLFFLLLAFLALFLLTRSRGSSNNLAKAAKYKFTTGQTQAYSFVKPLFGIEAPANDSINGQTAGKIKSDLRQLAQSRPNEVLAVYFKDLTSYDSAGINQDKAFTPASLSKMPLMAGYLRLAESQPAILGQPINLNFPDDNTMRNIDAATSTISVGQTYTVADLLKAMIIFSDNNAYVGLKFFKPDLLKSIYGEVGINLPTDEQAADVDNYVSPQDYSLLFESLYHASLLNSDDSEKALDLLSQVYYKGGLVAGVPQEIKVAHKFGERKIMENGVELYEQLHDCGIIYAPGHPYLLCVMTQGQDFNVLQTDIQDISRTVYNDVKAEN
jgi:beta-lactamase class A